MIAGCPPVFFEFDAAPDVLRTWRDYIREAPREPGAFFGFHQARVRKNYGAAYDRLSEVMARWDPENLFHPNQNVESAA